MSDSQKPITNPGSAPQRGIYLLPNLLTTAALFAGFYAIVAGMKGQFNIASIAIFVALVADGLDGRVARMTNTQTPFGAQYDSLSDMVAFGLAPALLVFNWSLSGLGKLGWVAAFLYTAGTALRLARFNTQVNDKRYFQGLPCPAAAGMITSFVWLGTDYELNHLQTLGLVIAMMTILVAALMVSSIRYWSFKSIDFKGRIPFFFAVIVVFVLAAIAMDPTEMLFSLFGLYLISGPILTLWQLRKVKQQRQVDYKNHSKRT